MSFNNNFHHSQFLQSQPHNYPCPYNPAKNLHLLINKKSKLQQINQQIIRRTSDIKQQHHNHYYLNNDYQLSYHKSKYDENNQNESSKYYSGRFSQSKNNKFNYGPKFTYFNQIKMNSPQTVSQIKKPRSNYQSKVNFFYDNPYHIITINNHNNNHFQISNSNKYTNIYHQPYKSTDFILFSNQNNNQPQIKTNNSTYKNVKFNYINNTPISNYSSQKSLKRTRSEKNFTLKNQVKQQSRKSQYKKCGNKVNHHEDIFYEMDKRKTFQDKKSILNKQNITKQTIKQNQTQPKPPQVKTTQISSQKAPNIFVEYFTELKFKQTRLIGVILITLSVIIFIIQLIS